MIEYRILTAATVKDLQAMVSAHLNEHWACVGGVSMVKSALPYYMQAIQKGSTT